jgi:hypothetical protein
MTWEMRNQGGKLCCHKILHGLNRAFTVFKSCDIVYLPEFGPPAAHEITEGNIEFLWL